MIKVENFVAMNFENAIRGARNPLNSWDKSDSFYDESGNFVFGEADLDLAARLCRSGSDHRKFIRQIFVSVDITAPLYWWKEFDTYKVGTVANSTSTMHKIHSKEITLQDFSTDKLSPASIDVLMSVIERLEQLRTEFISTKEKAIWDDLIQLLPSSYNQMRTCSMNYEVLRNMYRARNNHKLDEWRLFCDTILELPYADPLIVASQKNK